MKGKVKTINLETQRGIAATERQNLCTTEARRDVAATKRQNLCTTEARSHGENQKMDELFWTSGTLGLFQGAVSLFKLYLSSRKMRTRIW